MPRRCPICASELTGTRCPKCTYDLEELIQRGREQAARERPISQGFSILLAEASTKTWCYITSSGDKDTTMMYARNEVDRRASDAKKAGKPVDLATLAEEVIKDTGRKDPQLASGYLSIRARPRNGPLSAFAGFPNRTKLLKLAGQ